MTGRTFAPRILVLADELETMAKRPFAILSRRRLLDIATQMRAVERARQVAVGGIAHPGRGSNALKEVDDPAAAEEWERLKYAGAGGS